MILFVLLLYYNLRSHKRQVKRKVLVLALLTDVFLWLSMFAHEDSDVGRLRERVVGVPLGWVRMGWGHLVDTCEEWDWEEKIERVHTLAERAGEQGADLWRKGRKQIAPASASIGGGLRSIRALIKEAWAVVSAASHYLWSLLPWKAIGEWFSATLRDSWTGLQSWGASLQQLWQPSVFRVMEACGVSYRGAMTGMMLFILLGLVLIAIFIVALVAGLKGLRWGLRRTKGMLVRAARHIWQNLEWFVLGSCGLVGAFWVLQSFIEDRNKRDEWETKNFGR
ncbi:uncharacterized protein KY384_002884 [Bacidia gigantensis]|uniref:uncharacterized protein n=1 Tax=Bacidia gigantensis TaxID=2732470 RepID=UPI001D05190C|nr:uncharacterized protein KY384_002884 [Bacidia gigantensis]KAG8532399.1 hypothetical protein KY384_002884 [Bacidia gigantensis]